MGPRATSDQWLWFRRISTLGPDPERAVAGNGTCAPEGRRVLLDQHLDAMACRRAGVLRRRLRMGLLRDAGDRPWDPGWRPRHWRDLRRSWPEHAARPAALHGRHGEGRYC